MIAPELSDSDFFTLAESEQAAQAGSSSFTLETETYGRAVLGFHRVAGQFQGVSLTTEAPAQASTAPSVYSDGQNTYGFPAENKEALAITLNKNDWTARPTPPYPERFFSDARPNVVSAIGATALLHETVQKDARRLVFFTGAGISLGGEVPIYDHAHFLRQLGVSESATDSNKNDAFCRAFITQEGRAQQVHDAFLETNNRFFADASTPAHCAIAGIIRATNCEPLIFTTNHDLKHEGQGSRVGAIKVPPYWHDDICRRPDLASHVHEALLERRGAVDLAVVVGTSRDYRRFFEGLRGGNDAFKVLAVNNSPTPPPYVGPHDYYLHGDAQEVLPQLSDAFVTGLEKTP